MRIFKGKSKLFVFLLCGIIQAITSICLAQEKSPAIAYPAHQKTLNEFKSAADGYCAKNLNRFGLEELKKYDKVLDSMFAREKADTLATLQKSYANQSSQRLTEIQSLKSQSDELNRSRDDRAEKYHRLLRKASIAVVVWLAAVLLMLSWRKRLIRKSQSQLDANLAELKTAEENYQNGEALYTAVTRLEPGIQGLIPAASEIQKTVSGLVQQLPPEILKSDPFKQLQKDCDAIRSDADRIGNVIAAAAAMHAEPGSEMVAVNINQLCNQYTDLVGSGMNAMQEAPVQVTRDFEKNLPAVKVAPGAAGYLLLNVLINAFESVQAKQKKQIKGYVPKVAVSTRILPRFVQIRIKNNGDGMTDDVLEQVYEPFFSTHTPEEGAGLGLHFSQKMIRENKGEIKMESQPGNGTDVYIKFFTQS